MSAAIPHHNWKKCRKMSNDVKTQRESSLESEADSYTDLVIATELADYGPVRGCMVIMPYGQMLWNRIQTAVDAMIIATNHKQVTMPMLIPQSFLAKEEQHVEGFTPECAVVTHGGGKVLDEPLIIRPTSETMFNHFFKKWVKSWRDLPLLLNQWANVIRWEKRTRPFLRTREFLWQEGHTCHATAGDAQAEAQKMLDVYRTIAEDWLALPVICGTKTERERFAGAVETLCIEAMMRDGKALQAGTSHFLGQNFARAFAVQFQNEKGELEHVWQTSWGVSTRLIGALVLGHGDDRGLILPPKVAPYQVVLVPIYKDAAQKELVFAKCRELEAELSAVARVHFDDRDFVKPGAKFYHWEQRGVPLRINVGPRDVANNVVEIAHRDTMTKEGGISQSALLTEVPARLEAMQKNLFARALKFRADNTVRVESYEALKQALDGKNVFVEAYWAGSSEEEGAVKEETKATIRCIPFAQDGVEGKCIYTGKTTNVKVIFARAY